MRASASLLLLASLLALLASPFAVGTAHADSGTFGVLAGGSVVREGQSSTLRPTLRAEASLRLAGPLYAGAYLQATGSAFPMNGPLVAGGLSTALRFDVPALGIRPYVLAEGGRLSLPTEASGPVSAWNATAGLGFGIPVLANAALLDLRVTHSWLFDLPSSTNVQDEFWNVSAGLTVPLP